MLGSPTGGAMPKLTIEQSHGLDPAAARQRLDALSARLADRYGIRSTWRSPTEATFDRIGASGTISVRPGKVVIQVDLSFALTPLKGKVESRIRDELAAALAPAPPAEPEPAADPATDAGAPK